MQYRSCRYGRSEDALEQIHPCLILISTLPHMFQLSARQTPACLTGCAGTDACAAPPPGPMEAVWAGLDGTGARSRYAEIPAGLGT